MSHVLIYRRERHATDVPASAARIEPVLAVRGLRVELTTGEEVVSDISFEVTPGTIVGLVGESGSGKTTIGAALLGHARVGAHIVSGEVKIANVNVLSLSPSELRAARGSLIAHVAQDSAMALNPSRRIEAHMHEVLRAHQPTLEGAERDSRVASVFSEVGLPSTKEFLRRFPHQLSGGQQQRVQLALAFVLRPKVIVLDEPTTALDVTTQARVLETIRTLCRQHGVAAVYVSHDLAVVRNLVDRVVVLYAGRIVETAPLADLFDHPRHPYTQGLLGAVPDLAARRALQPIPGQAPVPGTRPHGCAFAPRCPLAAPACAQSTPALDEIRAGQHVACHRLDAGRAFAPGRLESAARADARGEALLQVRSLEAFYGHRQVLFDVSLEVAPGECVAVVGESGSGKTTTARAIAGLGEHARGEIHFNGKPLSLRARQRPLALRRQIQYIFQNPYRALNPRHTVGVTLTHALRHFFDITPREAESRAIETLERVSLQRELLNVYPRELSGGERQRVAIARALVCEPSLLVCDEITSALDVSVQANILALLRDLQSSGLALLFVTHGLGIVRTIADRVVVLHEGRVVEHGAVDQVLDRPAAEYTRTLVRDSPTLDIASSPSEIVRLDSRPPVVRELVSQGIPE